MEKYTSFYLKKTPTEALPTCCKIIDAYKTSTISEWEMGNFFEKLLQSGTLLPRQWRTNEKATANQQKIQNRRDGHCLELHCRLLCCGTTLLLSSVASLQHAGFLEKLFGHFQKANKQKQFYLSCLLEEIIRGQDC